MPRQTSILLIDDDASVREALRYALAVENYRVVPAADGQQALREFRSQPIDVLLLDVNPRHENGWDTLRRLTALEPRLPVIAMTARLEQQEQQDPASSGQTIQALLEKPLNLSVLLKTLARLRPQTPTPEDGESVAPPPFPKQNPPDNAFPSQQVG